MYKGTFKSSNYHKLQYNAGFWYQPKEHVHNFIPIQNPFLVAKMICSMVSITMSISCQRINFESDYIFFQVHYERSLTEPKTQVKFGFQHSNNKYTSQSYLPGGPC